MLVNIAQSRAFTFGTPCACRIDRLGLDSAPPVNPQRTPAGRKPPHLGWRPRRTPAGPAAYPPRRRRTESASSALYLRAIRPDVIRGRKNAGAGPAAERAYDDRAVLLQSSIINRLGQPRPPRHSQLPAKPGSARPREAETTHRDAA